MTRACHGPCEQGRLPCPTPEACEVEEEPKFYGRQQWRESLVDAIFAAAICSVLMVAVVAFVSWVSA